MTFKKAGERNCKNRIESHFRESATVLPDSGAVALDSGTDYFPWFYPSSFFGLQKYLGVIFWTFWYAKYFFFCPLKLLLQIFFVSFLKFCRSVCWPGSIFYLTEYMLDLLARIQKWCYSSKESCSKGLQRTEAARESVVNFWGSIKRTVLSLLRKQNRQSFPLLS